MANHTIEIRDILALGIPIFDFPYQFYDPSKKTEFENNFIKHFYFREIGCETVDRFKWYLQDKMNTVFPYYNELFKATQIEYDVLDNYKLTETLARVVDNTGKSNSVISSVGKQLEENTFNQTQDRNTDTTGNTQTDTENNTKEVTNSLTTTSQTVDNDTSSSSTTDIATAKNSSGTSSNTVTATSSKDTTSENSKTSETKNVSHETFSEKYLDTPQGLTDLTDSKYLTSLKLTDLDKTDTQTGSESSDSKGSETLETSETQNGTTTGTETETNNQIYNASGTSDTQTDGTSQTDTTTTGEQLGVSNTDTSVNEVVKDTIANSSQSEQKHTLDNNTRTEQIGKQTEEYTLTRRGNIGVDTDSQGIEKHLQLQKVLKNIEKMFFDECEDLFMLVY